MYAVGTALAAALAGSQQPCARLIVLDADRVTEREVFEPGPAGTARLLGGTVTYDRNRAGRRSGHVELENRTGSLSPRAFGDLFATGGYIRVERGAIVGGQANYIPLATLAITSFQANLRGRLSVDGEDVLTALSQPMGIDTTLDPGMRASDALVAQWGPALGDSSAWSLDDGGRTLGTVRVLLEDQDRLTTMMEILSDLALEAYTDRSGNVVLRPVPDYSVAPSVRTYTQAPGVAWMTDLSRTGSRLPFNRVIVVGEPDEAPTVRAVADVTDPSSPIHASRIGLRVAPLYRSARIPDQAAANAVASQRLIAYGLFADAVGGSAIPDPAIDEADALTFTETITGADDRYIVDTVSHPVTQGSMSLGTTKIVPVFAE